MLLELRVENLLLIERAELRLGPGLNAITGETGAGKTMLAQALDLLLGGKPRSDVVRPGAAEAYVEGVFSLPPGLLDEPALADLRERLPEGEEEIVLSRRVGADGRTRAFVQGRSASASDLRELGGRLVAFYGQHEHRRLALSSAQLDILDGFCGPEHLAARDELAAAHARVVSLERELDELRARAGASERERDLLAFELAEIDELAPSEEEERELLAERERLRRLDGLRAAAGGGAEAIAPAAGDGAGVAALLAQAEALADGVRGVDPALDALAERLRALRIEAEDLGTELRAYEAGLEEEPGRLEQVEERLSSYDRLKRKHGGTVEAVIEHARRCRQQLSRLEDLEGSLGRLVTELDAARAAEDRLAARLSEARHKAAPRLAKRVQEELADLALDGASFEVRIERRDARARTGDERVELMIAPNPGVPAQPLRETASGGETSRVMLALMSVAASGGAETLVFDEVDSGVGGQTARVVGEKLRALGGGRQVLCITHLPQIASLAEHHFRIEKTAEGGLARTSVERLEGEAVVEELCRMLGADSSDAGARRHAQDLLAAAA
ncbi:MAG: DNA repair protein RecN [Thermoleophilaceae bacterium]|nr:DNA repair protein RecN [Thermoleophilaceae bacterium]